jgi:uncharacterized coiled-coil protein SlyX
MALKDDLPAIVQFIKDQRITLGLNEKLFQITEGDLQTIVIDALATQLSEQSFDIAKQRIAPINILNKVVDKLSKIYNRPPTRELVKGGAGDEKLLEFYTEEIDPNTNFGMSNEFFNTYKNVAVEAFVNDGIPKMRVVPGDRFLFYSSDLIDPTQATHYIKFLGSIMKNDVKQDVIIVYSKEELIVMNEKGERHDDIMASREMDGTNPLKALPAVHINRSRHLIVPLFDHDMLAMTVLFPVLLTDLNYAVMFQAFSIIYGIDIDVKNMKMAPNSFWSFKSDANTEKQPVVDQIKPQVDITEVIGMAQAELSFWLNSKGIRPGAVGQITAENFSSGLSKIVDEMDTFENRQKQVPFFEDGESEWWNLLFHHYHPHWVRTAQIKAPLFSPSVQMKVKFPPQRPMQNRNELLDEVIKEKREGFMTQRMAIQKLNPDMQENEIDELLAKVAEEKTVKIPTIEDDDDGGEVAEDQDQDT